MRRRDESFPDDLYQRQDSAIHEAMTQLGMELDDVRAVAKDVVGVNSLRILPPLDRWDIIQELQYRGAKVYNPPLPKTHVDSSTYYHMRLEYWGRRFQKKRAGFATNKQLAWIEMIWEFDFDDGGCDSEKGLRGLIFKQTKRLENGPVSDLAFLRSNHVDAVLTPLREHSRALFESKFTPWTNVEVSRAINQLF